MWLVSTSHTVLASNLAYCAMEVYRGSREMKTEAAEGMSHVSLCPCVAGRRR